MFSWLVMKTPSVITYSDGSQIDHPVIKIWEDLSTEQSGYYRAFWCASPDADSGSPVIGHCSPGGSHKKQADVIREVRRLYPDAEIYYANGRKTKL